MIACIALVLSVLALAWQVLTYWLQSQRAKVSFQRVPPSLVKKHGLDPEAGIVMVTVETLGSVPVQVQGWAVVTHRDKKRALLVGEEVRKTDPDHAAFRSSPEAFPFVVQGHSSGNFYIPVEPVEEAIGQMKGVSLEDARFQVLFGAKKANTDRASLAARLGGG